MADAKNKIPAKSGAGSKDVSSTEDVSGFLAKVKAIPPASRDPGKRGRLIFAMDATMSRQPTWDRALQIQSQMFAATEAIGGLDVQLVYFRGFNECRASKWASSPMALASHMNGVDCRGGNTQISKVLAHIKREAIGRKVSAAVYVGDCMEENIDHLCQQAGEIALLGVPIFMFQEGSDPLAQRAFHQIAHLTHGAYFRFDAASAKLLRELLSAVAVYAAGGRQALANHSMSAGGSTQRLLEQLG